MTKELINVQQELDQTQKSKDEIERRMIEILVSQLCSCFAYVNKA
jgi:hypothetical protein